MRVFPPELLEDLRRLFSSRSISIYRGPAAPRQALEPVLRSMLFREGSQNRIIDVLLESRSKKPIRITLMADDFNELDENTGSGDRGPLNALADHIYMLATEWVFDREDEVGFPERVYLRPFHSNEITSIDVTMSYSSTNGGELRGRASVYLDDHRVGVLTKDYPSGEFVAMRRPYRVRIDVDDRYPSNEITSKRSQNRVLMCRVDEGIIPPLTTLDRRQPGWIGNPTYPQLFTISSEEERAKLRQDQPFRRGAIAALRDAAATLWWPTIDAELAQRGWTREVAHDLARECTRVGAFLEEAEWQLPARLGDLGLERWLSAYVWSSPTDLDELQEAVLTAAKALRALTGTSG